MRGGGCYLIAEWKCAVTKKITEKQFFWFGILTMKILVLAICDTRPQKNPNI